MMTSTELATIVIKYEKRKQRIGEIHPAFPKTLPGSRLGEKFVELRKEVGPEKSFDLAVAWMELQYLSRQAGTLASALIVLVG